jgi:hypothetical protein
MKITTNRKETLIWTTDGNIQKSVIDIHRMSLIIEKHYSKKSNRGINVPIISNLKY